MTGMDLALIVSGFLIFLAIGGKVAEVVVDRWEMHKRLDARQRNRLWRVP